MIINLKAFNMDTLLRRTIFILFFLFSMSGFSQNSYSRKQIAKMKYVRDVVKYLPDSTTVQSYVLLGSVGGSSMTAEGTGNSLNSDARKLMSWADLGSKV